MWTYYSISCISWQVSHRRMGRHRGRGAAQNLPSQCNLETSMEGPGSCFWPPDVHDVMVFKWSKWILSNPEGLFALKICLICPETQFSQTSGGGARPPGKYAYEVSDLLIYWKKEICIVGWIVQSMEFATGLWFVSIHFINVEFLNYFNI